MARYPANHKGKTRRRILGAAGRVFRTHGYACGGIGEVMGAATLTKGGFYSHFESKDDLFVHAIEHMLQRSQRQARAVLAGSHGLPLIRKAIQAYLSPAHLDREENACPLPCLISELHRATPEARQIVDQFHKTIVQVFADHLSFSVGSLERARPLASGLFAMMVGAISLARAAATREDAENILAAARITALSMVDCLERGGSTSLPMASGEAGLN